MTTITKNTFLDALATSVGANGLLSAANDMAPYLTDWRGIYVGQASAVVRPANRDELAKVVTLCAEHKVIVVPQGGNTGMCGAATPSTDAPSGSSRQRRPEVSAFVTNGLRAAFWTSVMIREASPLTRSRTCG